MGCGPSLPEVVRLSGYLVEGPAEPENQQFVPGASAQVFNRDGSEELGTTLTGGDGFFQIGGLPPAEPVVLVLGKNDAGDPHPYGVFTGFTENVDLTLFVGAVYAPTLPNALDTIDEYAAAPGAPAVLDDYDIDFDTAGNGGMLVGRVGRWVRAEFGLVFEPLAEAEVVINSDGTDQPVCYRAEPPEGDTAGAADCSATQTAIDSRFAAFGLPPGPVTITVTTPAYGTISDQTIIVEDGVTHLDFFAVAFP